MKFEALVEIIKENFSTGDHEITMDTLLREDLELDSLDAVELSLEIENVAGKQIPDGEFANFKTVGDILNYLNGN
ncbi:MAG: acyl carrier protein [Bacillota bacterium]|nr:acyl carrier protein [Bacillota bacterium]